MSENFPGLPPAPPPTRPKDAAAVVLVRERERGREVFWLRRRAKISFGGFYAFPGGKLDAADAQTPIAGATGEEAALRVAAAREVFEETGILVGRGAERLSPEALAEARQAMLEQRLRFPEFLEKHGVLLQASDFAEAGRWITPTFMPTRVDARFFAVQLAGDAAGEATSSEHTEGGWISPRDALARWENGSALLHPPNLHAMRSLAYPGSWEQVLERLRSQTYAPGHIATRIEFQQGIRLFPLETPTLPPATHTNAYVLGNGELLIVDPGAAEVRQYARLLAMVSALVSEGMRVKAVLLTHHHEDHVGGAMAVRERLKVPLWCHEKTAQRLAERAPGGGETMPPDRLLKDGEVISLAGLPPMRWRVLHTPGHASGHICLFDQASRALIAGDMVSGLGTIVIDPPEGDMTQYLEQLRRLKALPVGTLYPAHGPAIPEGVLKLDEYLRHREERERKVVRALPPGGATLGEIVAKAYDDTPEFLHPLAERSTLAVLLKLAQEGRLQQRGERFIPYV